MSNVPECLLLCAGDEPELRPLQLRVDPLLRGRAGQHQHVLESGRLGPRQKGGHELLGSAFGQGRTELEQIHVLALGVIHCEKRDIILKGRYRRIWVPLNNHICPQQSHYFSPNERSR